MDPDASRNDNVYAPPVSAASQRREPWTISSCVAASVRTCLRFPVLAGFGLGVIPNLGYPLGFLQPDDSLGSLTVILGMFVVSAVLAGGCFKLALELARRVPVNLGVYLRYASLAPRYLVLGLPLSAPVMLVCLLGEVDDPSTLDEVVMLLFVPLSFIALYLVYRLSLASYALVEPNSSLRLAMTHSWRRIGANAAQFFALFVVTSVPLVVSFGLTTTLPLASALFQVVTSPLVTLCWVHAYEAGVRVEPRAPSA